MDDELRYGVHVDDSKTYAKPFTISLPLSSPPGYELLLYECHEGNYMLRCGARPIPGRANPNDDVDRN